MRGIHAEYWKIETSSEPKTKLNMNMQMRLLKMFVKRNIRGDIVIEKNPFSDFIDVKECQEWFWWCRKLQTKLSVNFASFSDKCNECEK